MTSENLPPLLLPAYDIKIASHGDALRVFDSLRNKWVALTPEEYVRQHFVNWLSTHLGYPPSLMANEISLDLNGTRRRCDTLVFNPDGSHLMIVEYKAPSVRITQDTFDQIVRYNMVLKARYLVVSNGMQHYCCVIDYDSHTYNFIPEVPRYTSFNNGK